MGQHKKTRDLIAAAHDILADGHPMTVRQAYYQLVSKQVVENNLGAYAAVSRVLVAARQSGVVPWEWIEDRLRRPRTPSMWAGPTDFASDCCAAYRRDVWESQPRYVECWLEKDALSGIFEDVLRPYGVTLNVGRGFDGWSSIYNAGERYRARGVDTTVLYYGDFDPSGECMVESLRGRLASLDSHPEIIKVSLTAADIEEYHLPPDVAKKSDRRARAFIAAHGDISVELDALPVDVLRQRLEREVRVRMDLDALAAVKKQEEAERAEIERLLRS